MFCENFLNIAYSTKRKSISYIYPEKLISYLIKEFNIKNSKILEPGFEEVNFKQFENFEMQTYGMDYTKYQEKKTLV